MNKRQVKGGAPPPRPSPARTILYLLSGPLVWAVHFTALYGPQSLLCARGQDAAVGPVMAAATAIAALALLPGVLAPARLAGLLRAGGREPAHQAFLESVVRVLSALSLFAVLAGGTAGWILPACPGLR